MLPSLAGRMPALYFIVKVSVISDKLASAEPPLSLIPAQAPVPVINPEHKNA